MFSTINCVSIHITLLSLSLSTRSRCRYHRGWRGEGGAGEGSGSRPSGCRHRYHRHRRHPPPAHPHPDRCPNLRTRPNPTPPGITRFDRRQYIQLERT